MHRLNVVAFDDLLVVRRSHIHSGLLTGALERGAVIVAERHHLRVRAQRESRQMILQADAAASDNRNADEVHVAMSSLTGGEYGGPSGKGKRGDVFGCRRRRRPVFSTNHVATRIETFAVLNRPIP